MKRGVIAIVKCNRKFLLLGKKEGFQTIWQFPSCEVKENEEPEMAVLARLKENLSLDISLKDFLDILILPNSTIYFYDCSSVSEEILLPKSYKSFSWVEPFELENYLDKKTIDALPKEVIRTLKP